MLFNSIEYLFFFIIVLSLSWITIGIPKLRLWILLLASYYFYASNNYWLIVIFIFTTQFDYVCAIKLEDSTNEKVRKIFLLISLISNLSILCFFKYFNFFASSVFDVLSFIGYKASWVDINITLPVGISFYTFQSLSYVVDVYRREIKAVRQWPKFTFFVAYFPHMIAGPIIRPHYFLPQLEKTQKLTVAGLEFALTYIGRGLVKKIIFGDFLANYADKLYNNPADADFITTWIGILAFTFQIYFDFSGYSDIAIGSAKLMGFDIPENFKRPYIAKTITDFWRRWHISLSSWLRDYLYIPLGGNRVDKKYKIYKNLMITMLLGGLWHGASWHFILWGGLQGGMLSVEKLTGIDKLNFKLLSVKKILFIIFTFFFINLSWIVFRSHSMRDTICILSNSFRFKNTHTLFSYGECFAILISLIGLSSQYIDEYTDFYESYLKWPVWRKALVYSMVCVGVILFASSDVRPFIYFQF